MTLNRAWDCGGFGVCTPNEFRTNSNETHVQNNEPHSDLNPRYAHADCRRPPKCIAYSSGSSLSNCVQRCMYADNLCVFDVLVGDEDDIQNRNQCCQQYSIVLCSIAVDVTTAIAHVCSVRLRIECRTIVQMVYIILTNMRNPKLASALASIETMHTIRYAALSFPAQWGKKTSIYVMCIAHCCCVPI